MEKFSPWMDALPLIDKDSCLCEDGCNRTTPVGRRCVRTARDSNLSSGCDRYWRV